MRGDRSCDRVHPQKTGAGRHDEKFSRACRPDSFRLQRMSPAPEGRYDLLTLGETLLRLSPPGVQRLDQARLFEIGVGGSELNVGCLLARLGRSVAWVSRLPVGPLGRIVDGEARRHGVDTRWVRWIENARLGLMFYESFMTASIRRPRSSASRMRRGTRWCRRAHGCTFPVSPLRSGRAAGR